MLDLNSREPEKFDFKAGKKTYSIPHVRSLPYAEYRELIDKTKGASNNAEIISAVVDMIERLAPGSTKDLTVSQADALVTAYMGGGAGE